MEPVTRRHKFDPGKFAIIRIEDPQTLANMRADAVAFYKPVNSQEMCAVERVVLSQLTLDRISQMEAGFFTTALETAIESPGVPYVLRQPEITDGIQIAGGQNRAYWLSLGFRRVVTKEPDSFGLLMRYHVQAERLHRRAIEEFERLKKLRGPDDVPMVDVEPVIVPERPELLHRDTVPESDPWPALPPPPAPQPEPADSSTLGVPEGPPTLGPEPYLPAGVPRRRRAPSPHPTP